MRRDAVYSAVCERGFHHFYRPARTFATGCLSVASDEIVNNLGFAVHRHLLPGSCSSEHSRPRQSTRRNCLGDDGEKPTLENQKNHIMNTRSVPKPLEGRIQLGSRAFAGLTALAGVLGVTQNTAPKLGGELNDLVGAPGAGP